MNKQEIKLNNKNSSQIHILEITTIAKGAGIFLIGMIIGVGLRYLFELILARNLGPKSFGIFFLGLAFLKITEIISTLGLHRGALRYIALFRGGGDKERTKGTIILALRTTIIVALVVSLLVILLSKFISLHIFHEAELVDILKLFAIAIPFTALTVIIVFSTQGFKIVRYRVYVREIFEPVTRIICIIVLFAIGWKLLGAIFAFIVSTILGTFLAFYYLIHLFPDIINKNIRPVFEYRKILDFSWPLLLADFFGLIIIWINILMIGYFRSSQEVGIYSAAHRTALLGQIILISFNSIFSPIIADLYNRKEFKRLEHLFKIVTKWILNLSLPICFLMILFASEILNLFGENFKQGVFCLILLSSAQLINSVIGSSGFLIMMSGKSKINLLNNIIVVSFNIALNLYLIPRYGITGAAVSLLISAFSINIIRLIEVHIIFKLHPFRVDFYKPLIAGGVSFLILKLCKRYLAVLGNPILSMVSGFITFLLIYFFIVWLFKIEKEDKIILRKIKSKLSTSKA